MEKSFYKKMKYLLASVTLLLMLCVGNVYAQPSITAGPIDVCLATGSNGYSAAYTIYENAGTTIRWGFYYTVTGTVDDGSGTGATRPAVRGVDFEYDNGEDTELYGHERRVFVGLWTASTNFSFEWFTEGTYTITMVRCGWYLETGCGNAGTQTINVELNDDAAEIDNVVISPDAVCNSGSPTLTIYCDDPSVESYKLVRISDLTMPNPDGSGTVDVFALSGNGFNENQYYTATSGGVTTITFPFAVENKTNENRDFEFYVVPFKGAGTPCRQGSGFPVAFPVHKTPEITMPETMPSLCFEDGAHIISGVWVSPATAIFEWSIQQGNGTLSSGNVFNPTYAFHADDAGTTVILRLSARCGSETPVTKDYTITVKEEPVVVITDATVCAPNTIDLTTTVAGATTYKYYADDEGEVGDELGSTTLSGVQVTKYWVVGTTNGCDSDAVMGTATINAIPVISLGDAQTALIPIAATTQLVATTDGTGWSSSNEDVATVDATGKVTGVGIGTTMISFEDENGCEAIPFEIEVVANWDLALTGFLNVTSPCCEGTEIVYTLELKNALDEEVKNIKVAITSNVDIAFKGNLDWNIDNIVASGSEEKAIALTADPEQSPITITAQVVSVDGLGVADGPSVSETIVVHDRVLPETIDGGAICQNESKTINAPAGCEKSVMNADFVPTAVAETVGQGGFPSRGDKAWSTTNATGTSTINLCTSTQSGEEGTTLLYTGFDFSSVLQANPDLTIVGVEVSFERRRDRNILLSINDHSAGLTLNGLPMNNVGTSEVWDNGSIFNPPTWAAKTYNVMGTVDVTKAMLADPTFGFYFAAETQTGGVGLACADASIRNVTMTLYYEVEGAQWYATATGGAPIHTGPSITFDANGGSSNSPATSTATADEKKVYLQCGASVCRAEMTVTVNALPVFSFEAINICSNETVDLTALEVAAGSDPVTFIGYYTDAQGQTEVDDPTEVGSGTYYIKGEDTNGCTSIASIGITLKPVPVVTVTPHDPICAPGSIDIATMVDGATTYEFFSDAALTEAITNTEIGVSMPFWVVGYTDGCESAAVEGAVNITPLPVVTLEEVDQLCVSEEGVALTFDPEDGMFSGNGAAFVADGVFTPTTAGTYTLTYTVTEDGCTNSKTITIVVSDYPEVTGAREVCLEGTTTLTVNDCTTGEGSQIAAPASLTQTTEQEDDFPARGDVSWNITNPAQPTIELCANTSYGDESTTLLFSGFNFDALLPTAADLEILGVAVTFDRMREYNFLININDHSAGLIRNGASISTSIESRENWAVRGILGQDIWQAKVYGGATDKWGATLTREVLADPTFGFYYAAETQNWGLGLLTCADATIRNVKMTVYYSYGGVRWYAEATAETLLSTENSLTFDKNGGTLNDDATSTAVAGEQTFYVQCGASPCLTEVTVTVNDVEACTIADAPAADVCPGYEHDFSATGFASYAWTIEGNGTIVGADDEDVVTVEAGATCGASYTLTLTATDANGCVSVCDATVMVDMGDFTMPADDGEDVACVTGIVAPDLPVVEDACGNVLMAVLESAPIVVDCVAGEYSYVYTYTDCSGNTHDWTYTYNYAPTAPEVDGDLLDLAACDETELPEAYTIAELIALVDVTDACEDAADLTLTHVDGAVENDQVIRTYTITNACGLSTTLTQTIIIEDAQVIPIGAEYCKDAILPLPHYNGGGAWESSNPDVATVVGDIATMIGEGSVYFTYDNDVDCIITTTVAIVHRNPIFGFYDPDPVCAPATVDLTVLELVENSDPGLTYAYFTDTNLQMTEDEATKVSESGTYYITGTDDNGCTSKTSVTVVIYDQPEVAQIEDLTVCAGATVAEITFESDIEGGVIFTWERDDASDEIGSADSGTGSIPEFTATNETDAALTATFIVTATSAAPESCESETMTFSITVNPILTIDAIVDVATCSGVATEVIEVALSDGSEPTAITLAVPTPNEKIQIFAADGETPFVFGTITGNEIPEMVFVNTNGAEQSVTITVAAVHEDGCTVEATEYEITVAPAPVLAAIDDVVICSGTTTPATQLNVVTPSSMITGFTITIEEDNENITGITEGTVSGSVIPAMGLVNTTTEEQTITLGITPTAADGCEVAMATYDITVEPNTVITTIANRTPILSGGTIPAFTIPTDGSPIIGFTLELIGTTEILDIDDYMGDYDDGEIPAMTLRLPAGIETMQEATIRVTPYNLSHNGCTIGSVDYKVFVGPSTETILVDISLTLDVICLGDEAELNFAILGGQAPYMIYFEDNHGDTYIYATAEEGPYTYKVSPTETTTYIFGAITDYNGVVALFEDEEAIEVELTVNPLPTINVSITSPNGTDVCQGDQFTLLVTIEPAPEGKWYIVYNDGTDIASTTPTTEPETSISVPIIRDGMVIEILEVVNVATGCSTEFDLDFIYPINMKPMPTVAIEIAPVCEEAPFNVTIGRTDNGLGNHWSFTYNNGAGETKAIEVMDGRDTTILVAGAPYGSYNFTVTGLTNEVSGCTALDATVEPYVIRQAPVVAFTAVTDLDGGVCENYDITFNIERIDDDYRPGDAWVYRYDYNGVEFGPFTVLAVSTTFTVAANMPGETSTVQLLSVSHDEGECLFGSDKSIEFEVLHMPIVEFAVVNNPVCNGEEVVFEVLRVDEGEIGAWSVVINDGTTDYTFNGTGTAGEFRLPITEATTYTLKNVINGESGCESVDIEEVAIEVTLTDMPTATFVTEAESPLCEDEMVSFTITRTDTAPTTNWIVNYSINETMYDAIFTTSPATLTIPIDQFGPAVTVSIDAITNIIEGEGIEATECLNMTDLPAPIVFNVLPKPMLYIDAPEDAYCQQTAPEVIVIREDTGDKTDWTFFYTENGVEKSINVTEDEYTMTFDNITGTMTLVFTNVINNITGCENPMNETVVINVNTLPTVTFASVPAHGATVCEGEEVEFTVMRTDAIVGETWGFIFRTETIAITPGTGEEVIVDYNEETIVAHANPFTFLYQADTINVGDSEITKRFHITKVTDSISDCTAFVNKMIELEIFPKPVVEMEVNAAQLCANESFDFSVTRIDGGHVANWSYEIGFAFQENPGLDAIISVPVTNQKVNIYNFIPTNWDSQITADTVKVWIERVYNDGALCEGYATLFPDTIQVIITELPKFDPILVNGDRYEDPITMCEDEAFELTFTRIDASYTEGNEYIIHLSFTGADNVVYKTEEIPADTSVVTYTVNIQDTTLLAVYLVEDLATGCSSVDYEDLNLEFNMVEKPQIEVTVVPQLICGDPVNPDGHQVIVTVTYPEATDLTAGWEYTIVALPEYSTAMVRTVESYTDQITFYVDEYTTILIYDITDLNTGCVNEEVHEFIVVKPNVIVPAIADRVFCEDALAPAVVFESLPMQGANDPEAVTGEMVYTWTVVNNGGVVNFPEPVENMIPAFTPELDDAISTPVAVEIAVMPFLITDPDDVFLCEGNPVLMTFYYVPNAEITNLEDYSICDGEYTLETQFEGHYTRLYWENIGDEFEGFPEGPQYFEEVPVIFPEIQLANKTEAPKALQIKVNSEYKFEIEGYTHYCEAEGLWTITVNPEPTITNDLPETVYLCNADVIEEIQLEGTALEFRWRATGEDVGIEPWGVWTIAEENVVPAFIVENLTRLPRTVIFEYVPIYGFSFDELDCWGEIDTTIFIVNPEPTVGDLTDYAVCDQITVSHTFNTEIAQSLGTSFEWENIGDEFEGELPQNGVADADNNFLFGPYTLTNQTNWPDTGALVGKKAIIEILPVYDNGVRCEGEKEKFEIVVNPTPRMIIQSLVYCHEEVVEPYYFLSTTNNDSTTYVWEHVSGPDLGIIQFGVDYIPGFTAYNYGFETLVAIYKVTPTYTAWGQSCTGETKEFLIIVNPRPIVSPIADKVYCADTEVPEYIFTGTPDGATYEWTQIDGDVIEGIPTSGFNVMPAFTAVNNGTTTLTATYEVIGSYQMANFPTTNCVSEVSEIFTISIVPNATLAAIANVEACMGEEVTIELDGTATQYNWTVVEGQDVGLNYMSGTIDGAATEWTFTAKDNLSAPIYAIIEVVPVFVDGALNHTCTGDAVRFRIDVSPSVEAPYVTDYTFCSSQATPVIAFNGPIPGTVYRWEVIGDPIPGLPAVGYGDIPSFIPVNNTVEPIVYTIEVGANNVGTCSEKSSFTITVMPQPTIAPVSNLEFCASATAITIPLTGVATAYNWSIIDGVALDPSAGTSGTLSTINYGAATFTINAGINHTTIRTATYQIVPVYGSCVGDPITFTVTVYPEIHVDPIENRIYCNDTQVDPIVFSGNVDEIVYYWNIVGNSIPGLPQAGIGNIPSFFVQNTTTEVVTYQFEVQPSINLANGSTCAGTKQSFSISVVPEPSVNAIPSFDYCANEEVAAYEFTGTATKFVWTKTSGDNIGLPVQSGENKMPAFKAVNNGTTDLTATFEVTPYYTHTLVGQNIFRECVGTPVTFTITVHPDVQIMEVASQEYCSNENVPAIELHASVPGAVVKWVATGDAIGLPTTTGYGDIPAFTAMNTGATIATATITLTIDNNCSDATQIFTIKVYPQVKVDPSSATDLSVCTTEGSTVIVNPIANVSPVTFKWINDRSDIGWPWETITNTMYFEPINNTNEPIVANITIIPLYIKHIGQEDYCEGDAHTFTITVQPKVGLTSATNMGEICGSETFHYEATASIPEATLTWRRAGIVGINGGQGASGVGAIIEETLYNATSEAIVVTYTFTMAYNGCQTDNDVTVTVLPAPIVVVEAMASACPTDAEVSVMTDLATGYYKVALDQAAKDAGYEDVPNFMPFTNAFTISSNRSELTPGIFTGKVTFRGDRGCDAEYAFSFRVYQLLSFAYITDDITGICGAVSERLEVIVNADGDNALTYTWYYNNQPIANSNNPAYTATAAGTYRVEVTGAFCSGEKLVSHDIVVGTNNIVINQKWDDVLYVDNEYHQFVSYRWYKNGYEIGEKGDAQYYSLPIGSSLEDEYMVRVYYADGRSELSCPQKPQRVPTNSKISVYPNPVANNNTLTVRLDMEQTEIDGAQVSVYDVVGREFATQIADRSLVTFTMDVAPGVYVVRVVSASGEVYTEKVVVR